ncbi:MAG: dihydroorotate dehydrogenase [Candidatus Binatia bacterium]
MTDLSVTIGSISWPSPIGLASGTCGYGEELERRVEAIDWSAVGAIFTKGISLEPRAGNPPDWAKAPAGRITEIEYGAVNSIGLANVGIDAFVSDKMPFLRRWRKRFGGKVIVNIFGETVEEYATLARVLDETEGVDGVEINLSCPNVSSGGIEFGQTAEGCARVTEAVRRATTKFVVAKLSPLCAIVEVAPATENAGADALSIANTLPVLLVDVESHDATPPLQRGGLSGPALRPIAVRMTYEARKASCLPVIGIGGIACARDALEFILAGATAVQIGTALFADPDVAASVRTGIEQYLEAHQESSLAAIVGGR